MVETKPVAPNHHPHPSTRLVYEERLKAGDEQRRQLMVCADLVQ